MRILNFVLKFITSSFVVKVLALRQNRYSTEYKISAKTFSKSMLGENLPPCPKSQNFSLTASPNILPDIISSDLNLISMKDSMILKLFAKKDVRF